MALQVFIDGVDRTELIQPGSFEIVDDMNARNTLRFLMRDPTASVHIDVGDEVIVYFDGATGTARRYFPMLLLSSQGAGAGTRSFAGTVDDAEENLIFGEEAPSEGGVLDISVTVVDFNQLPDRFLVAEAYENEAIEDIFTDLIESYLTEDGVTVGQVDAGAVITRKIFNYISLTDALNWLSEQTGYVWTIDYSKVATLLAPDTIAAPFVADGTTVLEMRTRRPRGQYRNRQLIRGGRDLTDPRTESFVGDGTRRTFNVSFPVGTVPTITVNGSSKVVGIRGVDSGVQWYWNRDNTEVSQDNDETILTTGDTLAVTYQGLFPILVQAQDDAAITERVLAEGGSGIYEAIEDQPDLDDADMALDTALAKLQREGMLRQYVEIVTDEPGLLAGQLLEVNEPALNLAGLYLVQSVTARDIGGTFLRYSATVVSGDAVGGWLAFYQRLMNAKRDNVARENESLLLLRVMSDTVVISDVFATPVQATKETRVGIAKIGMSEIGETAEDAPSRRYFPMLLLSTRTAA